MLVFERRERTEPTVVRYTGQRLGRTQVTIPLTEVVGAWQQTGAGAARREEIEALRRKATILALLYDLSRTLGSVFDLKTLFEKVTDILFRVTPADRAVALLVADGGDAGGAELLPVAARMRDGGGAAEATTLTVSRTISDKVMRERVALLSQDATADPQFAGAKSIVSGGVRSTICAPLVVEDHVHGVLYADRLDPSSVFTRDDLELLSAIAAQTAVAVESVRAHERLAREEVARANYSRFLPEHVVRQMLERPDSFQPGGVSQLVTVLFADIRGFTRLAEHAPPAEVVALLNRYFSAMTEVIFAHGGTLDKFIGDGLLALFGAPRATDADAANAAACAAAMQRRAASLCHELRAAGLPEVSVGIGLHTGEAIVGYVGSETRLEYTAIGDTVNLAARLESHAPGGCVLASEATARALPPAEFPLRAGETLTVKNRTQPVQVYELLWRGDDPAA
ncbi:MAG: GAF domain-containing protein [Acidobacteria bacterium]|nr:GAF domain-containing protein [Acidobacteriota bacterium]